MLLDGSQGPTGPDGAPGHRGAPGFPVSLLYISVLCNMSIVISSLRAHWELLVTKEAKDLQEDLYVYYCPYTCTVCYSV